MVTRWLFTGFVLLVALERLLELRISRRHERSLRARGALEHAAGQMPWMVGLHAGWLVCALLEVWWARRPMHFWLAVVALALFGVGQALRLTAMRTLGERWTARILTLPEAPVTAGIFRHLRHPNYLGVVLEIAALPLVHGAYLTAGVSSLANALLLVLRIRAEERALSEHSGYAEHFSGRPRFMPTREG